MTYGSSKVVYILVNAVFYHGIMTKDTTGKPGIQAKVTRMGEIT